MKFKLIQVAVISIFVISVVALFHAPYGFGHDLTGNHTNLSHPPQFYVDCDGKPMDEYISGNSIDPRQHTGYFDSSGNGTENASSWELKYYPSPLYSGDGGKVSKPKDPNSAVQKRHADLINTQRISEIQMVFGARCDFSASAGNSSCSGSVTPNLVMDMGLTTDYAWGGEATITLKIPSKTVHSPSLNPNICTSRRIEGPVVKPLKGEVEIRVSDTTITNKQSGEIKVSLESGSGSVSASYTEGTEVQRKEVHAYPYGFSMTLSVGWWHAKWYEAMQMDKSATVSGFLTNELIDPDDIYVEFEGRPCPLNDHDSGT